MEQFPASWAALCAAVAELADEDVLLVGTGRRAPTGLEKAQLGELAWEIPFVLG